ncbi:MAG TPA: hypothetical protein GXZ51_01000 [Acholeplasma sp.]|jgi:hypothetical protein|nr:hypothetical protein [Acholeplasma sp.]
MDASKTKKMAITSLIMQGVAFVLTIIFVALVFKDMIALIEQHGEGTAPEFTDVIRQLYSPSTRVILLLKSLLGVADLILIIMIVVETSKLKSKTPMIFLLIGLAVGVLKIVGLIMTLVECNKQLKAGEANEATNN